MMMNYDSSLVFEERKNKKVQRKYRFKNNGIPQCHELLLNYYKERINHEDALEIIKGLINKELNRISKPRECISEWGIKYYFPKAIWSRKRLPREVYEEIFKKIPGVEKILELENILRKIGFSIEFDVRCNPTANPYEDSSICNTNYPLIDIKIKDNAGKPVAEYRIFIYGDFIEIKETIYVQNSLENIIIDAKKLSINNLSISVLVEALKHLNNNDKNAKNNIVKALEELLYNSSF